MGVDCIEDGDSLVENWNSDNFRNFIQETQRWNGRDIEVQTWNAQLHSVLNPPAEFIQTISGLSLFFNLDLLKRLISPLDNALPNSHLINQIEKTPIRSCRIETEGVKRIDKRVLFINGMNTSFEECKQHLEYIKAKAGNISVQGVYNHSNGIIGDIIEIFSLSYAGSAPATADLLIEAWTEFHNDNKGNPDAKCLQISHSMGNILVENALRRATPEIRDRVIVRAFGPAKMIPEGLCYHSLHYASKKDKVPYGENFYNLTISAFSNEDEPGRKELLEKLEENKKRLISLDPHPDAIGMDHDIESPTFDKILKDEIEIYILEAQK